MLDIFERTASPAKPPSRGTGGASARPESMQAKFADLLARKTCTHALLAIRGPGAIIGDDSLRCASPPLPRGASPDQPMILTQSQQQPCPDATIICWRSLLSREDFAVDDVCLVKINVNNSRHKHVLGNFIYHLFTIDRSTSTA